jgi:putative FmdB family regulatory protein
MPVYTYHCENCGVRFDRYQKFTDQPLTWCPECSKKSLRKVFQPVGIVFKGSGFYATDHKSPSGGQNVNAPKSEAAEKAASGEKSGSEKSGSDKPAEKNAESAGKSSSSATGESGPKAS